MFPSALSITRRTKRKTVLIYCMPSSMVELTGGIVDLEVVFSDTRAWRCSPDRGRLGNEPENPQNLGKAGHMSLNLHDSISSPQIVKG
jgi:hypothetical protein